MLNASELAIQQVNVLVGSRVTHKQYELSFNHTCDLSNDVTDYITHLLKLRPHIKEIKPLQINLYGVNDVIVLNKLLPYLKHCEVRLVQSSLLSPDYVNANNLTYVIESDGCTTYGQELLANRIVAQYDNVVVHSTIHDCNHDFYKLKDYVNQYRSDCLIEFSFCRTDKYLNFDTNSLATSVKKVAEQLAHNMIAGVATSFEHDLLINTLDRFIKAQNKKEFYLYPNCQLGVAQVTIDLAGNQYVCPHLPVCIGTVTSDHYNTVKTIEDLVNVSLTNKKCKTCDSLCMCNGGCLACNSELLCKHYKTFYDSALYALEATNALRTEIEL